MSRKPERKSWDSLFRGLANGLIITVQIKRALQGCVGVD
jgi:hypothetical protein